MTTRRREWSPTEWMRSSARAAYLFLNMVPCSECGLPWPEGLVHDECPGPPPLDPECGKCRHPRSGHRRAAGGTLLICRQATSVGAHDLTRCWCRSFRQPKEEPSAT